MNNGNSEFSLKPMARARNIKPGFFTNGELSEIHPLGRLLFAGLWTIADREGRLQDRPKTIKGQVLPFDDCDVDSLLDDLSNRDFIQRYEVDGIKYLQIKNWKKHQNPHIKEAASTIPEPCLAPEKHSARTVQAPDKTQPKPARAVLIPDSLNLIPDSITQSSSASTLTTVDPPTDAAPPSSENSEKPEKPPDKPQPTRAGLLAMTLRAQGIDTASTRAEIVDWAKRDIPDTIIAEAVTMAKNRKPNQRISSAYLAPIVEQLLNPPEPKRTNGEPNWWMSEKGIETKARELGCWPARAGETFGQLAQRIREKMGGKSV